MRARVPQQDAGDLFAPPEPAQRGLFDQPEPKGQNAALEPEQREARSEKEGPKPGDGYGEKNTVFTKESREEALKKLREISRQRSNIGIDPEYDPRSGPSCWPAITWRPARGPLPTTLTLCYRISASGRGRT